MYSNGYYVVTDPDIITIENCRSDFLSRIDTTFALYPPRNQWFLRKNFYHAIRTKMPFMAKHGGWYIDSNKLTDE